CLASLHDVATLVYDGISKMNGQFHIQLPADLYAQWQKTVADVERDNNRKNEIIASVFTAMSDIRTCPVLINGHSLAQFYPNPGHRVERSIDYYISDEKQAQHAAEWMDDHSVSHDDSDSNVTRY
ncbi:nucleotidyltransferase family protein, partial [Parabacteroides distasonis]